MPTAIVERLIARAKQVAEVNSASKVLNNDILEAFLGHNPNRFEISDRGLYIARRIPIAGLPGLHSAVMHVPYNREAGYSPSSELGITGIPESLLIVRGRGLTICSEDDPRYTAEEVRGNNVGRFRFDGKRYAVVDAAERSDISYYRDLYEYIINPDIQAEYVKLEDTQSAPPAHPQSYSFQEQSSLLE